MFQRINNIYKTGLLFISLFLVTAAYAQDPAAGDILLINSYNKDVKWSADVIDSIAIQLQRYSSQLKIQHLQLNHNENPAKTAASSAAEIIRRSKPEVVILVGDEAEQAFLASGWTDVKSLVINTRDERIPGGKSTGGAGFNTPLADNLKLIQTMVPNLSEIVFIDRQYPASEQIAKQIEEVMFAARVNNVTLNIIYLNSTTADKLYQKILENKPGRAILTATWNFFDSKSSYTRSEVDQLFSKHLLTPVFSIFPNYYSNDFLVGGYNLSIKVCADKITEQTKKLLQGTSPSAIAFEPVKNGDIILNKAAIDKLGLANHAKTYFDVRYVNGNPSIFELYKYEVIGCGILLLVIIILVSMLLKRIKANRNNNKTLKELKEQFAFFNQVYNNVNLNFAIYNTIGEKIMEVLSTSNHSKEVEDFLPANLFNAEFLTKEDTSQIKGKKNISKEYNSTILEKYTNLSPSDGRVILFIARPMQSLENDTYKYIVIASDITDSQQDILAKEALSRLIKDISNVTNIGVASYNVMNGKGFATPSWFSNLGEPSTGDLIQPDYSNCSTEDKAKIIDFRQELINGKATRLELDMKVYNPSTGKEQWIRENIFLNQYEPKAGIVEVIDVTFDITKDKLQEIHAFTLNKKAESANRDGDRFISGISHEIRTPLNSIIGFSNMLTTLSSPGDRAEIITIIKRNNVILIELINNILSIAKMDAGMYNFEKDQVMLNEFFLELKTATAHMVTGDQQGSMAKNIHIVCDIPESDHNIVTDAWNFRQVMINLLSNAVKFTDQGTIVFGYQPQEEGIYFYVKDTGCGIASEHQDRIFNRFERFGPAAGSGLGLSLCKSIVSHLNGEIGVISKEGEGSTFWFILKYESEQ